MKKSCKCLAFLLAVLMMLALLPAAALAASEEPAAEEPTLESAPVEKAAPTEEAPALEAAPVEETIEEEVINPLLSLDAMSPYEIGVLDFLWEATKAMSGLDKDITVISPTCTSFSWGKDKADDRLLVEMYTDLGIFGASINASPTLAPDTVYTSEDATLVTLPEPIALTSGGVYYTYEDSANVLHVWALFSDDNKNLYFLRFSADLLQPEELSIKAPAPNAGQSMEDWEDSATIAPESAKVIRLALPGGSEYTLFGDDVFMPGETYELSFAPTMKTDTPMMLDPRKDFSDRLLFDGKPVTSEKNGSKFTYTVEYTVPMTADDCDWIYIVPDKLRVVLSGEKDMEDTNWLLSLLVDSNTLLTDQPLKILPDEECSYDPNSDGMSLPIVDGEVTYLENKDERTLHVEGWFKTEDGTVREFSYDGALICPGDIAITAPMPADGESFEDWRARVQTKPGDLDPFLLISAADEADDNVFRAGHFYEFRMMFSAPDGYTFSFDHDFSEDLTFAGRHVWFENMGSALNYYAEQLVPEAPAPTPVPTPAPKPAAPKTGDSSHALLWAVLVLGLGTGAAVVSKKKFN